MFKLRIKTDFLSKIILACLAIFITGFLYATQQPQKPVLAQTPPPKTTALTFQNLKFDNQQLKGPLDNTSYSFNLPADWIMQPGSYVELNVDYNSIGAEENDILAQMEVFLNDRLLHVEPFRGESVSRLVQVGLPPDELFIYEDQDTNALDVNFLVNVECDQASQTTLNIKDTSLLSFNYTERAPILDLLYYPRPIYHPDSFEAHQLYIVHSQKPSAGELRAIAMISAKLGEVIGEGFVITTTSTIPPPETLLANSHVIILGTPQNNPLITQLTLPIVIAEREHTFWSEMPATVLKNQVFSYTLNIQNTSLSAASFTVVDRLPRGTILKGCTENCNLGQPGTITWKIDNLEPEAISSVTVVVSITNALAPDDLLEHVGTLYNSSNVPINTDSLAIKQGPLPTQEIVNSLLQKSPFFFSKDGIEIAETDGLVQEIQSPWSNRHVAIVVTGLNDEALIKAGQALGGQNNFPGMQGQYVVIQDTRPFTSPNPTLQRNRFTLADLGFPNETVVGALVLDQQYSFSIPGSWKISDDAYFNLHFANSTAFSGISSTLNVSLNNLIVGSASLNDAHTISRTVKIPLPGNAFEPGENDLDLSVSTALLNECMTIDTSNYWITFFNDSELALPHEKLPASALDLEFYVRPFNEDLTLKNLVLALPNNPTENMVQGLVNMLYIMGNESGSSVFSPEVTYADENSLKDWANFNIIAIGLPTDNAFIAEFNDNLPQSFYPGTNQIQQKVDNIIYRISPETSIGLVQELVGPKNPGQAILAITGTNDEGLSWAQAAMGGPNAFNMFGNLAYIRGNKIQSIDTRITSQDEVLSTTQSVAPELQAASTVQPTPTLTPTQTPIPDPTPIPTPTLVFDDEPKEVINDQPRWLVPLLVFSIALLIAAIGGAIWRSNMA